jgi:hypothetical protein
MEAPLADKLPEMKASQDLISKYIEQGDGQKALNAVESYEKARIKQMEPLMGADGGLRLTEIPDVDATGQPINRSVFVSPQGDLLDLNRQPLNQSVPIDGMVLPPRDGVPQERRIQPMPKAGFGVRPATSPSTRTETQQKLDELALQKAQDEAQSAVVAKASNVAKTQSAIEALKNIRNHPGRWAATGLTSKLPTAPGSNAYDFEQKLEQAKALAGTIGIEAMRGLGAMSEKEFQAATASIAALDKGQKTETIEAELDKLIGFFESRLAATMPDGKSPAGAPPNPSTGAADRLRAIRSQLNQ